VSRLPIEVHRIYIEDINYKLDLSSEQNEINLQFETHIAINKDDEKQYMVVLKVSSPEGDKVIDLSSTVKGYFEVPKELKSSEREDKVYSFGTALCYSHLRETVESICARIAPQIHLPVVAFTKSDKE
jgi:preprotein translocase subunit SecB